MRRIITACAVLTIAIAPAVAKPKKIWPGPYRAEVVKVIDGDTVRVVADVWPGIVVPVSVRLSGVDTPESRRPKCAAERNAGKKAAQAVRALLKPGDSVALYDVHGGKYAGRVVARIQFVNDAGARIDLGQWLIARHLARPYFGGHKADWCAILKGEQQAEQEKAE